MNELVKLSHENSIVIFDGECKFCNGSVNFIIRRDPQAHFKFIPSQHALADEALKFFYPHNDAPERLILIQQGQVFVRSRSVFRICHHLQSPVKYFWYLRFIPAVILDPLYILFAKNRHRISGGKQTCIVPSEDVRTRFIE